MKFYILSLLVFALSVTGFADDYDDGVETETVVLRTVKCIGTVAVKNKTVRIKAKIVDTKYTETFKNGNSMDEYWSTLTITDAENPSRTLYGNLTSTDTSEDIADSRNSDMAPAVYNLFVAQEDASDEFSRVGLVAIGCDGISKGECKEAKGKNSKHEIGLSFAALDEDGNPEYDVTKEGARHYNGRLKCQ